MMSRSHLILSSVAIVALGSAMAMAQTAPSEPPPISAPVEAVDAPPISEPNPPSSPEAEAPGEDGTASAVEDAPVETSGNDRSDWAPDINLDAQTQATETTVARHGRIAKKRKVLSDAGDNPLSTNNWTSVSADAELLSRAQRRARPVDPAKRADLAQLSRVMGALHALRVSCAGRDDQTYRSRMATLLDLEAPPNGDLRDPLVDAFNAGFQSKGRGAGACPADSRAQEAGLARTGLSISRKLSAQYRPAPKAQKVLPPANQPRQNVAVAPAKAKTADWDGGR
jgi:uncharacterized protein (TIGR02301 family)